MITVHPIDTIVSDSDKHRGQPIIVGTGIRVSDVVASYLYRGLSPDELAVNFALDLGQVYAALAYYYQHKARIDTQMREEITAAAQRLAELAVQGKLIRIE